MRAAQLLDQNPEGTDVKTCLNPGNGVPAPAGDAAHADGGLPPTPAGIVVPMPTSLAARGTALDVLPQGAVGESAATVRAEFGAMPAEIIDAVAAGLPIKSLCALATVDRRTFAILELRRREARLSRQAEDASGQVELQAVRRQAQDFPTALQARVLAASARCIERLDEDQREEVFTDLLRAGCSLRAHAPQVLIELSIRVESLPSGARKSAIVELLDAAAGHGQLSQWEVFTGLLNSSQPVYRGPRSATVLFNNTEAFIASVRTIQQLPATCRALPLTEYAYRLGLDPETRRSRPGQYEGLLRLLPDLPERDLHAPLLELTRELDWLPLASQGPALDDLCDAAARLPPPRQMEFFALALSKLSAMRLANRVAGIDRLVRTLEPIRPAQRAQLLAQIAARVKMLPTPERFASLRAILEATVALHLPERLTPLVVVFFQARSLPAVECSILHAQCRVLWQDEEGFAALSSQADRNILEQIRDAACEAGSGWRLGLIVHALNDYEQYEAASGVRLLFDALQRLAPSERAPLMLRLASQFHRLDVATRQDLCLRLVAALEGIPASHHAGLMERLVSEICNLRLSERAAPWRAVLAATRQLDASDQIRILSALHHLLVEWLEEPLRLLAFMQFCRIVRQSPPPQRMPMLAQLTVSAASLPQAEQAAVYHAILDASESLTPRRVLLALVRKYSRALARSEWQALRDRCEALCGEMPPAAEQDGEGRSPS